MVRPIALTAAIAVSLLAVSGAGGAGAQTPRRGGTVRICRSRQASPRVSTPVISSCAENDPRLCALRRFALGPDLSLRPKLVSHVDFTTKPPFTLTYHIRPEARWSDGVPITARDFVFTHQAIRKYSAPGFDTGHRTRVRSVRALDAKTVSVVLRAASLAGGTSFRPSFRNTRFGGRISPGSGSTGSTTRRPATRSGAGLSSSEPGSAARSSRFVRNPHYWGPHRAYLDRIIIRYDANAAALTGAEAADLFRTGEVDIIQRAQFSEDLASALRAVARRHASRQARRDLGALRHPGQSARQPGLEHKLVRRALAYGIDRVALVRALYGDVIAKARPLDSDVFLGTSRSYKPNWSIYRYRPALARRLLEQAGVVGARTASTPARAEAFAPLHLQGRP